MSRIYKTMQGKEIDMDQLMARNETMPAVGNVRVNARGDELGPDGKIIRTREEVLSEYYDATPTSTYDQDALTQKVRIKSERTEFTAPQIQQPVVTANESAQDSIKARSKEVK